MAKKTRKRLDFNQIARKIVDQATAEPAAKLEAKPAKEKDPVAVTRGQIGGLKGGKARAAKMSKAERSESAKKAAKARWSKTRKHGS